MQQRAHISTIQALMIGISSITVTGHLLFIPIVIGHAGRDSWISLLVAIIPFLIIGYLVSSLSQQFQGKSIVQYAKEILGKWLGGILSFIFIFYIFHDASLSIRGFGEFYTSAITPNTPIVVFFVGSVILGVYTVRSGVEVMARTNQLFLAFMIPIGLLASILTHKDKDYRNLLPVLAKGFNPVVMGSLSLLSVFSTFIVLSMIFPYVKQPNNLKRWSLISILILIIMFAGPITGTIALFGEERSQGLAFPTFLILRDIRVGELQRLDILAVLLWSMGSFSKISIFLYAIVTGIAHLFELEEYRFIVLPVASLLVIVSLINSDNFLGIYEFLRDIYPYYSTSIGVLLPLVLWCAARILKKGKAMRGG